MSNLKKRKENRWKKDKNVKRDPKKEAKRDDDSDDEEESPDSEEEEVPKPKAKSSTKDSGEPQSRKARSKSGSKKKEKGAKKDELIPFDPFGPAPTYANNTAAMQRVQTNPFGGAPQQQQQAVNPFFTPAQGNPFALQGGFNAVPSSGGYQQPGSAVGTGFSAQGNVGYSGQVGVGGVTNTFSNLNLGGNNSGFGSNNTSFGSNNAANPFQLGPAPSMGMGMGAGVSQPVNPFMAQQQMGGAANPFAPTVTQAVNPFLSPSSGINQGYNQNFAPNNSLF